MRENKKRHIFEDFTPQYTPKADVVVTPLPNMDGHGPLQEMFTPVEKVLSAKKEEEKSWEEDLKAYLASQRGFRERCDNKTLTDEDLEVLCATLEACGEDGMTLEIFASKLRLLEEELGDLSKKYPELEKSIKLARVNRKTQLLQTMNVGAHRSAAMAKELLHSDLVNKDVLQRREEENAKKRIEDRVLEELLERGARPVEYTQFLYVCGHRDEVRSPIDAEDAAHKIGLVPCEKFLEELQKNESRKAV